MGHHGLRQSLDFEQLGVDLLCGALSKFLEFVLNLSNLGILLLALL